MAAGFSNKTIGDGNGGTINMRMWSKDTVNGPWHQAAILCDVVSNPDGALVDVNAAQPVFAAGREYEFVAASSGDQPLGASGAVGDALDSLIIVPLTTSPGEVKIKDGTAGTYHTVFLGGASSVADLKSFEVNLNLKSLAAGGWIINVGANVQVFAAGDFT